MENDILLRVLVSVMRAHLLCFWLYTWMKLWKMKSFCWNMYQIEAAVERENSRSWSKRKGIEANQLRCMMITSQFIHEMKTTRNVLCWRTSDVNFWLQFDEKYAWNTKQRIDDSIFPFPWIFRLDFRYPRKKKKKSNFNKIDHHCSA